MAMTALQNRIWLLVSLVPVVPLQVLRNAAVGNPIVLSFWSIWESRGTWIRLRDWVRYDFFFFLNVILIYYDYI